jgi:hypothetical protein
MASRGIPIYKGGDAMSEKKRKQIEDYKKFMSRIREELEANGFRAEAENFYNLAMERMGK